MYEQSYDEYIRSILGYSDTQNYNLMPNDYGNMYPYQYDFNNQEIRISELEDYYPEIYKIIYPMVKKACSGVSNNITSDVIERMTDEIYSAIENQEQVQINISLSNEVSQNRSENTNNLKKPNVQVTEKELKTAENRIQRRNNTLSDLIKILLLRELLGRPIHRPRPPIRPPRPPFPGRPPIRPRIYEDMYDF